MPLVFGTLKLQKTDFYRSEHQKRKDKFRPFSSLAFLQPTTVDKEPEKQPRVILPAVFDGEN